MRKTLMFLLPVSLWIGWAQPPQTPTASAPPTIKKEPFKNLAPVSKEILKVKLPKAQETKLENGMTILILEDHRLPQLSIAIDIRGGGGLLDPAETKGLATLAA